MNNLEKFKKDIDNLIQKGDALLKDLKSKNVEKFAQEYEIWYSESFELIKVFLPNRLDDFKDYYNKDKENEGCLKFFINYRNTNYVMTTFETFINLFENQLGIVKAAKRRFESALFDIKQLTQADLFDSELDAARELNKKGFARAAGAIAGVVLEKHLAQVCENHNIKVVKKDPSINDFNQLLKDNNIIEIKDWRFIQHLADLRNLCDHNKTREPRQEEIEDLINGVEKVMKTIF